MAAYQAVFLIRQLDRFVQDGVGNADLADIVHERGIVQVHAVLFGPGKFFRQCETVLGNANRMPFGITVFCVYRICNRGDGLDKNFLNFISFGRYHLFQMLMKLIQFKNTGDASLHDERSEGLCDIIHSAHFKPHDLAFLLRVCSQENNGDFL